MQSDTVSAQHEFAPHAIDAPQPPSTTPMKIEELLALPEGNGERFEMVHGAIVRKPMAGGSHDYFAYRLLLGLGPYVDEHNLGAITLSQAGYEITLPGEDPTVYIPDLAFVRAERVPQEDSPEWTRFWKLAPDLVVEVASPSQSQKEMRKRAADWLAAGTRLVWLIWPPHKRVDAYYSSGSAAQSAAPASIKPQVFHLPDTLDGRDVVPGFTYPVASIFKSVH